MPIFEYQCRDCGAKFERIVSSSSVNPSDGRPTCRLCASARVEKLFSVFAVSGGTKAVAETGPCGACGAPQHGICGE